MSQFTSMSARGRYVVSDAAGYGGDFADRWRRARQRDHITQATFAS